MVKTYILMNKDIEVLKFSKPPSVLEDIKVDNIYRTDLLPYRLKYNTKLLDTWLRERPIPTNREHIDKVLLSIGLTQYDHMELLEVNNGCSLNDTYWIKRNDVNMDLDYNKESFDSVSLYRGFKESLGLVSFFGNTSTLGGRLRTPEITTQGMLGKAWRLVDDNIKLYKTGTSGYANAGLEPYMEVIASTVADIIGIPHIRYDLSNWKGRVCCVCDLFTSEDRGYLPMAEYLKAEVGETQKWTYATLKELLSKDDMLRINDMVVFDYIIENTDRHFNNFGFTIDNNTREIIEVAPLFDHGMSLHWNKIPSIDSYSADLTNKGTFDIPNSIIAKEIIKLNPKRYKRWAKDLKLNMGKLDVVVNRLVDVDRQKWVKQLLNDRTDTIKGL